MNDLAVSVVVVSQDRPDDLKRCLKALRFQRHKNFEVIVVSSAAGLAAAAELKFASEVKPCLFKERNISAARNAGIRLVAGDIVAFIDDDAIAEPTWLDQLTSPFSERIVSASGGFVRGRNGFSLQWGAEAVGLTGDAEPIDISGASLQQGTSYRAIKTPGTNCAFRRSVLIEEGGFDEFYRFFLDETDLNMRLGQKGLTTAIVPSAEVQHGFAPSVLRSSDRTPKSLFQICSSKGYFLRKFGNPKEKFLPFRKAQVDRVHRHLVQGGLEPRDVKRLVSEIDAGFEVGWNAETPPKTDLSGPRPEFLKFHSNAGEDEILMGRWIRRGSLFSKAKSLAEAGTKVTVFPLSPTAMFHRRWFHSGGFWVQSGGKFGKSNRDDPLFAGYRLKQRVKREIQDLTEKRHPTI